MSGDIEVDQLHQLCDDYAQHRDRGTVKSLLDPIRDQARRRWKKNAYEHLVYYSAITALELIMDLDFALELSTRIAKKVKPFLGKRDSSRIVILSRGLRTTKLDAEAAKVTRSFIRRARISCHLISEEWGHVFFGPKPKQYLVVDEFDGTLNATRGIPFSAVSVAISDTPHLEDVHTSVIYDVFRDVIYHAEKGKGAYRDGKKIRTLQRTNLSNCIMSIKVAESTEENVRRLIPLLLVADHPRDFGAAALELALLASGQMDAIADLRGRTRVTDIAGGFLLLKEAGGELRIRNASSVRLRPNEHITFIATSGRDVMNQLLQILEA